MVVLLLLLISLITLSLVRRDRSATSHINLDNLIVDDVTGKVSKSACMMMGAFAYAIWQMTDLTLTGKMTEGYFVIFCGAFVTPFVTKLVRDTAFQPVPAAPSQTTVNTGTVVNP